MNIEHFQDLVIGSGVAGNQGQRTAVIERSMVGGACPNVACLPSKNVMYSANDGKAGFVPSQLIQSQAPCF
jgi:pyruvate/2-oxoglutarate dehydrogenase complex dihydrolipoamide dehydrogenase (E3) component